MKTYWLGRSAWHDCPIIRCLPDVPRNEQVIPAGIIDDVLSSLAGATTCTIDAWGNVDDDDRCRHLATIATDSDISFDINGLLTDPNITITYLHSLTIYVHN